MLPVQTVMIRYMVLVYRWGDGWLSAVGDWEGFAGGALGSTVTGGCARGYLLAEAHLVWARARVHGGPADEGSAGPFNGEPYLVGFSSGLGAGKGLGSKSSLPTGIVNTLRSGAVNTLG